MITKIFNATELGKLTAIKVVVCLLGFIFAGQAVAANKMNDISVSSLPNDKVQIVFQFEDQAAEPRAFTIDGEPVRVVFDFPGTVNGLKDKNRDIGLGIATRITTVEAGGRTRAVVYLQDKAPFTVEASGNMVNVVLGAKDGSQSVASSAPAQQQPASQDSADDSASAITNIDFRRGESGEGRVIISLSKTSAAVDVRSEGGKIVAEFEDVSVPGNLQRRLDVLDFGTPVKTVDTVMKGSRSRIEIAPVNDFFEHLAYQSDNLLTIELRPLTRAEKKEIEAEKKIFEGERLTLNFQKIEIRAVLQLIADFTGMNIVVSDTVSGSLTLRLDNVPWDQALDIILKTKGLGMRQNGNVILIAPNAELAKSEKDQLESKKQIEELAPLRAEYIQVNFAKAADIAALLSSDSGEDSMLSDRGSITVDDRTNLLLVRDTSNNLAQIRKLVEKLDIPVRQVLIESRIVVASDNFSRDLGVRFGFGKTSGSFTDADDTGKIFGGTQSGYHSYGTGQGYPVSGGSEGLMVDLAAADPSGSIGMAIGKLGSYLLQLELSAMEIEGEGEVVSSPRIVTSNQSQATIKQGVKIPYSEAASSGAGTTAYQEAVLSLDVTPLITPDDHVLMDLTVKKDSVSDLIVGTAPGVDTREVTTQVLVKNGETVVLGGIYEQTNSDAVERVPFFGELPIVGNLFKTNSKKDNRSELLIFVTPKILGDGVRAE